MIDLNHNLIQYKTSTMYFICSKCKYIVSFNHKLNCWFMLEGDNWVTPTDCNQLIIKELLE